MLDASVIRTNTHCVSIKISDDTITHNFTITDDKVEYIIQKHPGCEPIARSTAEVVDIQEDINIRSMIIRTQMYDFEVTQDSSYTFHAYRTARR